MMETILEKIIEYERLNQKYEDCLDENEILDEEDVRRLNDALWDLLSISRALYITVKEQKKADK